MLDNNGLQMRAAFFRFIRAYFFDSGFLEVITPLRQPVYIPESNIIPLQSEDQFLQTSPELCMKRLLASGCEKIYQICHCFRKDECGQLHLEEFQMLEWYRKDSDYSALMIDCENLLRRLAMELDTLQVSSSEQNRIEFFQGVELYAPWQRMTVKDAFLQYSPTTVEKALGENLFDEVLVEYIEPHLGYGSPLFLYDYPAECASLAKKKNDDETVAERFELYIKGVEVANGFSELTDAAEQRQRFILEIASIKANIKGEVNMPERFLRDLELLESAAGIALGLDRLFMLAMNYTSVSAGVSFAPGDFL